MHKAGFVNIVGNPNVGKSTLMNQLVGERISIATFKAQTTRHRIMGIVNTDDMQIVFSDTPGVLKPNYKLQESMLAFSESALADADVLLYVTDVVEKPEKNMDFLEKVQKMKKPVILLINKIDVLGTDNSGQEKNVENSKPTHKSSPKNAQRSARLRQETLSKQSEERTLTPQIVINSGAKSERFMRQLYPELPEQAFIHYGNFIGETITIARELGVERMAMGVMIGKAVKLAEGKLDTHSHKTTMNIAFLKQMLAEAEVKKDIEGLNMARQLWSILTSEEMQRLEKIIIKHCHEHCDPLLPDGNIDIILISENVTK